MALAVLNAISCGPQPGGVRASGTIEMDEIDVASMVGGRITSLAVDEGDSVRAGDTLAVLARGEVAAQLVAQAAQAGRAAAQYRDVRSGPRPSELAAARSELAAATAQATFAAAEYERIRALHEQLVASASDLDRARSARDASVARRNVAANQVRLLAAGSRSGQIEAAAHAADAARAEAQAARVRVGELVLTAPSAGVVLLRNFEHGELVPPNVPVVTLGDPERLWMRCYVAAPALPRVQRGARVEVRVDGVKQAFTGHVVEIASRAEFTPRAALTEEERANLVFAVKVALDPTHGTLKAGLPAEARIVEANR
jgi:HlyD family secretion protein